MAHGHNCNGSCDHSHDDPAGDSVGVAYSLYSKIDLNRLECLNEAVDGSAKTIFKPWNERLDNENYVESDADEELLFNIAFTGNIKLKGIIVRGANDDSHPSSLKIYKNRPNMSFDDTSLEPDQEFELQRDTMATAEYPTKIVKFATVNHLTLYFPKNFGDDTTRIYYIGLKGDFTAAQRDAILIANYELASNPADHKVNLFESTKNTINH